MSDWVQLDTITFHKINNSVHSFLSMTATPTLVVQISWVELLGPRLVTIQIYSNCHGNIPMYLLYAINPGLVLIRFHTTWPCSLGVTQKYDNSHEICWAVFSCGTDYNLALLVF